MDDSRQPFDPHGQVRPRATSLPRHIFERNNGSGSAIVVVRSPPLTTDLPRARGAKRRTPTRSRQTKCRSCCSTKKICRSRSRSVCSRSSPRTSSDAIVPPPSLDRSSPCLCAQRETQQAEQRLHTHLKQVWADYTRNIEQIQPRERVCQPMRRSAHSNVHATRVLLLTADNEAVFKAMLPSARVKKMMQIENMMQERCGAAKFVRQRNAGGGARAQPSTHLHANPLCVARRPSGMMRPSCSRRRASSSSPNSRAIRGSTQGNGSPCR